MYVRNAPVTSTQQLLKCIECMFALQAMMELGACICTVHQPPSCSSCPISHHCKAYADVQQFLAEGGSPDDLEMPHVTQYPSKASQAPPAPSKCSGALTRHASC